MDPSLNSHFHLHIAANALVLIHSYEFWSARQLREHSLPPEALFWELRCLSFCSSMDGSRNARDASQAARLPRLRCHHLGFYGPMASLQRSWDSSDLRRVGSVLGEVYRQTMVGECIYRPGITGCICFISKTAPWSDTKCLCAAPWPPFSLIS